MTRFLAFVSAFFLFMGLLSAPALAEKRVALVIGNDRYEKIPSLQKAVNDARAVGDRLARLGFEVIRVENGNRRVMSEKIAEFSGKVGRGDTAAFFFAGHGVAIKGGNYLLPTDIPVAREGQETLVAREAILADSIIEALQERGARVSLLMLDACRDNPFKAGNTRGAGGAQGLAQMQTSEGVFVLYSAGVGQTALDRLNDKDADPNSVFTRSLVKMLDTPDITIQDLAKKTQSDVKRLAATVNHIQMPAYYDQIDGTFKLAGAVRAAAAQKWSQVPNSGLVTGVTVMPDGTIVGIGQDQMLYTRTTLSSNWVGPYPDSCCATGVVALADGTIVGIGNDRILYVRKTLNSVWVQVPNSGLVTGVTVMPDGTILGIGQDQMLYTRTSLSSVWVPLPNSCCVIGVTVMPDGTILGIGQERTLWIRPPVRGSQQPAARSR